MPRVVRSPPQAIASNLMQVQSEPDIPTLGTLTDSDPALSVTSKRAKRTRNDTPTNEFLDFKNEIKLMLNGWKLDLDAVLPQFNMITTWKADLDIVLSKLNTNVTELKEKCSKIQLTNTEIEKSIEFLNNNFDGLQDKIKNLEKDRLEHRDCIAKLERQVYDLQLGSRPATIEIRNLPAEDKESPSTLSSFVCGIGSIVGASFQPTDLRDVYRMPPTKPGAIKTIVAEFHSVQAKNNFLAQSRRFNRDRPSVGKLNTKIIGLSGVQSPVYVDEHLPPQARKLFYKAREFAKTNGYKFCWSANGKIFLRKDSESRQLNVRTEKFLEQLPTLN